MVRYLFYTTRDLTYQSPLVDHNKTCPSLKVSLKNLQCCLVTESILPSRGLYISKT